MVVSEILTIGAELLEGRIQNTNAQYLSAKLRDLGVEVKYHSSCDDQIDEIVECLKLAFRRAELVIVTGGLGPTPDDVTREAVARFFGTELKFHAAQYRHIQKVLKKLGRTAISVTRQEAFFPENGVPILNKFGIALGFRVVHEGKLMIVLPGVPRELESLYESKVEKIILEHFPKVSVKQELTVSLIGMDEAQMMKRLGKEFFQIGSFQFGSYPVDGRIILRLKSHDAKLLRRLRGELLKRLGRFIYAFSDESLESVIIKRMIGRRQTVAVAESCTAGLLGNRLTDTPGASACFLGGIVAYSNDAKVKLLCVPKAVLSRHGAVSGQVAERMARSVREKFKSRIGISITGIAGPAGGTKRKPVGTVWIGFSTDRRTSAYRFQLLGGRDRIRHWATQKALTLLHNHLSGK